MEDNKLIEELVKGNVVGHTTDTVFGLIATFNINNVSKINLLKGRDKNQPLQLLVNSPSQLEAFIKDTGKIGKVEPKTSYIVEASEVFSKYYPSFNNSIMFRVVEGELSKIIKRLGPLFASSANKHGESILTSWKEVEDTFGVITNKKDQVGTKASTIISLLDGEAKVIREE